MGASSYTSVYLSKEVKDLLVETARTAGYEVGCGRKSGLAKFVEAMLQDYIRLSGNGKDPQLFYYLAPELRSSIIKLSKMEASRQKRVSTMIELLFEDWRETEKSNRA
mgnify:CR=1 FL=1